MTHGELAVLFLVIWVAVPPSDSDEYNWADLFGYSLPV